MNCGGSGLRALELVHHLAFGHGDVADVDGETKFRRLDFHRHLAHADLAGERMRAAIAALGRIAQRQQEPLVAARQRLQAHIARRRKPQRLARQVARLRHRHRPSCSISPSWPRMSATRGIVASSGSRAAAQAAARHRRRGEIQQPMRIVVGRAEHLAAGQVLEHRGNAAPHQHRCGIHRQRIGEARQGGAIGAQQERRLDQVALRLLHRQRGEFAVVQRAFAHRAVDRAAKLLFDLCQRTPPAPPDRRAAPRPARHARCRSPARRP